MLRVPSSTRHSAQKEPIMIKKLVVLAVAGTFATSGWTEEAARTPRHEAMGLGSGAVIGAAAGGPVGFILGAAFGGWVGDRFATEREQRLTAEAGVVESRAKLAALEGRLGISEREADRLEAALMAAERSHHSTLQEALDIDVYFRTADSALNGAAEQRLTRIAELIAPLDDVVVLLEGHADARGDAEYNEELSAQRAETVRQAFVRAGVPAERIAVAAEGENLSIAEEKDVDALALERRVAISVVGRNAEQQVAQRSSE
jgi:outer membrane protein OmpA-like peptidoglycan-associated protein